MFCHILQIDSYSFSRVHIVSSCVAGLTAGPTDPLPPGTPTGPGAPGSPWGPGSPRGPTGPEGPGGPGYPWAPSSPLFPGRPYISHCDISLYLQTHTITGYSTRIRHSKVPRLLASKLPELILLWKWLLPLYFFIQFLEPYQTTFCTI